MDLNKELEKIKPLIGVDTPEFEERLNYLFDTFSSKEDKEKIVNFIAEGLKKNTQEIDDFIGEANIKLQLAEISEIISLSYIAKKYFHKTRSWLYHRINGAIINGKPAKFTKEEIRILNEAFQDISKKIGSTFISV